MRSSWAISSTIRNADRVVVFQDGRIVEQGTFAELWDHHGFFHKMLLAQGISTNGEVETPHASLPEPEVLSAA